MSGNEKDMSILRHILGYCGQIDAALERFGDDSVIFLADVIYQNAVSMCLLQIGELVGHLSEAYRSAHPQMPWRQMRALRNIIAHNYGSVDADTAWEIVKEDIPMLRAYCERETGQGAET
jgi:uncharacterized protein with HEPN domain